MTAVIRDISISQLSELFKITYGDFETEVAGWDNASLIGMVKKDNKFVGIRREFEQMQDYGGGQSSGRLPSVSNPALVRPFITAKRVYSSAVIDNESMKAARKAGTDEGAFMDATELAMLTLKGSFSDQIARMLLGNGEGALGSVTSVTTLGVGSYLIQLSSTGYIEANWMLNDLLNFGNSQDLFLTDDVDLVAKTITVTRKSGSYVPMAGNSVYKQYSKDQEMMGLKGVVDATTTLYGVRVGYRWKASTIDANGVAPSVQLFRALDQKIRFQSRSNTTMATDIILSATGLRLLEDGADAKSILYINPEKAPTENLDGQVASLTLNGRTVRLHWSPWCEPDRAYMFNRNKVALHLRPESSEGDTVGTFIDNGDSIFFPLQVSGTPMDAFQLFRSTYGEFYIPPTFVGCLQNLATS